jgi:glutamyl-tRNA synthetase
VDDTPSEQLKVEMMASVESTCRNNTAEENLSLWKEIVNGTE